MRTSVFDNPMVQSSLPFVRRTIRYADTIINLIHIPQQDKILRKASEKLQFGCNIAVMILIIGRRIEKFEI